MKAKINVAIIAKKPDHLVLQIFNGFGDPVITFVADSVQLDEPTSFPSCAPVKPWPLAFRATRFFARCVISLGYFIAAPFEALNEADFATYSVNRRESWARIWGQP